MYRRAVQHNVGVALVVCLLILKDQIPCLLGRDLTGKEVMQHCVFKLFKSTSFRKELLIELFVCIFYPKTCVRRLLQQLLVIGAAKITGSKDDVVLPGSAFDHTLCGRGADRDLTVKNKYGRERCFL